MAQPIYKTKNGQFSAAIFENPKGKSISLQKGYTDKEGNWQNQSITLFPRHVDTIIRLLQEAKKQCESPDEPAPEEGAASPSSQTKKKQDCGHTDYEFKKGKCWKCSYPNGMNSEDLTENIMEKMDLPGGDELIIEEVFEEDEEEITNEGFHSEMEEEEEMEALDIWNRCDDIEAD